MKLTSYKIKEHEGFYTIEKRFLKIFHIGYIVKFNKMFKDRYVKNYYDEYKYMEVKDPDIAWPIHINNFRSYEETKEAIEYMTWKTHLS